MMMQILKSSSVVYGIPREVYSMKFYTCVEVRDLNIVASGAVMREFYSGEAIILCVEYMYEKNHNTEMIHARILQNGSQTVLGNAANEREMYSFLIIRLDHKCKNNI
jgi:hypothetical protein